MSDSKIIYDSRLDDIEPLRVFNWRVFMIPVPRKPLTEFVDDDESDSLETIQELEHKERTTERWIDTFHVIMARLQIKYKKNGKLRKKPKYDSMLGIEFPDGKIIYFRAQYKKSHGDIAAITTNNHNLLFNIPEKNAPFLGLKNMTRCDICRRNLRKIYRCFDCNPKKSHHKTDFCKTCYIKREHVSHRVIALCYDEDVYDKYDYLDGI